MHSCIDLLPRENSAEIQRRGEAVTYWGRRLARNRMMHLRARRREGRGSEHKFEKKTRTAAVFIFPKNSSGSGSVKNTSRADWWILLYGTGTVYTTGTQQCLSRVLALRAVLILLVSNSNIQVFLYIPTPFPTWLPTTRYFSLLRVILWAYNCT